MFYLCNFLQTIYFAVVAAAVSFTLINNLSNDIASAGDGSDLSARKSIFVSSIEEASEIAGFSVATPDLTLGILSKPNTGYSIDVNQLVQLGNRPAPRPVGLSWELADGSKIRLLQAPGLQIPNIGEPITISNQLGERVFFEAESYMPPRVALYWMNGDIGFSLFGTLTDSVSEETLISIANSVAIR